MYCRNCGAPVHERAVACPACGVPPRVEKNFCLQCGAKSQPNQILCTQCGASMVQVGGGMDNSEKLVAGLLGIFLGALGIHKFYLGYHREGVIMLLGTLVGGILTCGIASGVFSVIGLVEGILYLTKSDEEFVQTYVENKKGWF